MCYEYANSKDINNESYTLLIESSFSKLNDERISNSQRNSQRVSNKFNTNKLSEHQTLHNVINVFCYLVF